MRSDIIHVTSEGAGIQNALDQAERVAAYKALSGKNALHLRLLTEEMMGMMRALTGENEADFWIDDEEDTFALHLTAHTKMNTEKRNKLLSVSSTGENTTVKGVVSKMRDVFERLMEPLDDGTYAEIIPMYTYSGADLGAVSAAAAGVWSLNRYKKSLKENSEQKENWDELEKSVIAKIADEVEIGIKNKNVEMTVYKKF